jgi:hypothetical protein
MKRIFAAAACGLALFGAGCMSVATTKNKPIIFETVVKPGSADSDTSVLPGLQHSTATQAVNLQPGEIASASKNVIVSSIAPNQLLQSPFVLLGRARSFENVVSWRVRDESGTELASGNVVTNAKGAGEYGMFRVRAFLHKLPKSDVGSVEVFTRSPRDGAEQDMVRIPVRLNTGATLVKAFFPNVIKDPDTKQCDVVYPVTRRVPKTEQVAEAAILELLDGSSAAEQISGSRTAIIPGAGLKSINVKDGVATVDFTHEFMLGISDVCATKALRVQVEQTLLQFSTIKVVKIEVEGTDVTKALNP